MDTFSHAAWGYAVLHRTPRLRWWGALAGAAPDVLWFVPSTAERVVKRGWGALTMGSDRGIWRSDGPPLPPELVESYFRYYIYTHSLVLLAVVTGCARRDPLAALRLAGDSLRAAHRDGHPDTRAVSDAAVLSAVVLAVRGTELGRIHGSSGRTPWRSSSCMRGFSARDAVRIDSRDKDHADNAWRGSLSAHRRPSRDLGSGIRDRDQGSGIGAQPAAGQTLSPDP